MAGDHDRAGRTTAYKSDYAYELPSLDSIRRFVVVAEHLKFGRAAEALHIAQPVLSRQIRALEDELKVQLFERDNRSTRLTPAGETLLEDARTLLPTADATRRRVRDVAAGQRTFTVGFMPGLIVTSAVRELSRRSALIHEYAAIAGTLADHITPTGRDEG